MSKPTRLLRVFFGAALTITISSCSLVDPTTVSQNNATHKAVLSARDKANKSLMILRANLNDSKTLKNALATIVNDSNGGPPITILNESIEPPGGPFTVDVTFLGEGEDGGGGFYKQIAVRLCVHYTGTLRPNSDVKMTDLTCPSNLSTTERGVPITSTISLEDH